MLHVYVCAPDRNSANVLRRVVHRRPIDGFIERQYMAVGLPAFGLVHSSAMIGYDRPPCACFSHSRTGERENKKQNKTYIEQKNIS